jgi:hypothetical protein
VTGKPGRPGRAARAAVGLSLALLLGCTQEAPPAAGQGKPGRTPAAGPSVPPVAARPAPANPAVAAELARRAAPPRLAPEVSACIERSARGPGYDDLDPRDARRRLRRLQAKASCEQQLTLDRLGGR